MGLKMNKIQSKPFNRRIVEIIELLLNNKFNYLAL